MDEGLRAKRVHVGYLFLCKENKESDPQVRAHGDVCKREESLCPRPGLMVLFLIHPEGRQGRALP